MSVKKKLLVIGGSSGLGLKFIQSEAYGSDIFATYYRNKISGGFYFNALEDDISEVLSKMPKIHYGLILIGDTRPVSCVKNPRESHKINVDSIISILKILKKKAIIPIFTSTDFVFDGKNGSYDERSKPNPIVLYSQQKLEVEKYIQENFSRYLILRLAKIFGSEINDNTLFSNWFKELKSNQTEFICASDQKFSPVYNTDVVNIILKLIEKEKEGIYNVCGDKALTRLECLEILVNEFNKQNKLKVNIKKCKFNDYALGESWPVDTSMSNRKLKEAVNYDFHSAHEICKKIIEENL